MQLTRADQPSPAPRLARSGAPAAGTRSPGRERNKRANVNQDAALYSCSCGYVFKAAVTTSVGLPALRVRAGLVAPGFGYSRRDERTAALPVGTGASRA